MNVRRLFPFALFVLLFAIAVRPTIDPDMWWHLRTGEAILRDGIPRHDLFSYTFPTNEWITHEWLSQVFMWGLYRLAGLNGLMIFFAAVTAVTWWLVYLIADGKPYVAGLVVAVAAKASQVVWGSRPQLFNLLLLAVFLYLLERRKDGAVGPWIYVAFPVLTLLWANLHSGFLLGIVVLGTYAVGEYVESSRRDPAGRTLGPGDRTRLWWAVAGSTLAALVNPNGAQLVVYPFETLTSPVQREFITEWFPPGADQLIFWLLVGLVVLGLVGFLRARRVPATTELLVYGGTAAGAFLSVRNIPIFAIAATPIICRHLVAALPMHRLETSDAGRRSLTVLAGTAIVLGALVIAGSTLRDNATTVHNTFPEAAIDWIEEEQLDGERIFNAYGWGGYLIWRGLPVFIDGRADVYGDAGLLEFGRTWFVEEDWQQPLDARAVELVVIPAGSVLGGVLTDSAAWSLEYEDPVAHVFARTG